MACAPLPGGSTSAAATSASVVSRERLKRTVKATAPDMHIHAFSPEEVAVLLRQLTVRQKVGQLVMPWLLADYAATDAPTMVRARMWVDSLQVGGIIISTGTPPGVGLGQKPEPIYLRVGQSMHLGISGLGEQRQRLIAARG